MGTLYTVKIAKPHQYTNKTELERNINLILEAINNKMSTYEKDSELSRLNLSKQATCLPVSQDLYTVIEYAQNVSLLTEGAFDITIGPLVNLWGFGPIITKDKIPSQKDIQLTKQKVGYQKLILNHRGLCINKTNPNLYIDLSAVAKGYAIDQVADYLNTEKLTNFLVEIGGDLRAQGKKPHNKAWQIAIENPLLQPELHSAVSIQNAAVATSGNYRNYFEIDGHRYSHEINPKTGWPIKHQLVSVTVIMPSAMQADALATGLLVLGKSRGFKLAINQKIAALFIEHKNGQLVTSYTPEFAPYRILE